MAEEITYEINYNDYILTCDISPNNLVVLLDNEVLQQNKTLLQQYSSQNLIIYDLNTKENKTCFIPTDGISKIKISPTGKYVTFYGHKMIIIRTADFMVMWYDMDRNCHYNNVLWRNDDIIYYIESDTMYTSTNYIYGIDASNSEKIFKLKYSRPFSSIIYAIYDDYIYLYDKHYDNRICLTNDTVVFDIPEKYKAKICGINNKYYIKETDNILRTVTCLNPFTLGKQYKFHTSNISDLYCWQIVNDKQYYIKRNGQVHNLYFIYGDDKLIIPLNFGNKILYGWHCSDNYISLIIENKMIICINPTKTLTNINILLANINMPIELKNTIRTYL